MRKTIVIDRNETEKANVEGTFLTYKTDVVGGLTITGSAAGLRLLAEKLLAAAEGKDVAPMGFDYEAPVSAEYLKMKKAEVERFIASVPRMEAGRSYVLTFSKDGKVRDLVVTCNEPLKSYSIVFEDHFIKYFLRFDGKTYHYVLSKAPSKERNISYEGTLAAIRFFLANEGDGTKGLSWKPEQVKVGA